MSKVIATENPASQTVQDFLTPYCSQHHLRPRKRLISSPALRQHVRSQYSESTLALRHPPAKQPAEKIVRSGNRGLDIRSQYSESTLALRHPPAKSLREPACLLLRWHFRFRSHSLEGTSARGRPLEQRSGVDAYWFERLSHCSQQ